MALQFFNTLTRQIEEFKPLDPAGRAVRMYCCGPTVHDYAHIGNFRTFVLADFVRRYLEFGGYSVTHVMNITDVEDKIIRRVRETGKTLREYTAHFEAAFREDHQILLCLPPHQFPRATDHMADIIDLIGRLAQRGLAYQAPDGSVYFSIAKYSAGGHRYGQLVPVDLEQLRPGQRVKTDEYGKESLSDFALWKARSPEDGGVFWDSPWGEGRPGWHIECSAMSMKCLGPSFDLHIGGEDLIFPHHEDEIAQSEGAGVQAPGERFVKTWLHGAFLLVEGRKMSKSLDNFFTLRDLLARGFTGREVRYLLLTAHYRESFNFTLHGLAGAREALARIDECAAKLRDTAGAADPDGENSADGTALIDRFTAALDDDLNVSAAWGAVHSWITEQNRCLADRRLSPSQAAGALGALQRVCNTFGLPLPTQTDVPVEIQNLAAERQAARAVRDFGRADQLRADLRARGWVVEDAPRGPKLKRV